MKHKFSIIFIIGILLSLPLFLTGCTMNNTKKSANTSDTNNTKGTSTNSTDFTDSTNPSNPTKLEADKYCVGKTGQKACPAKGEEIAVMETNYGTIKIKFFSKEAPKTVANFKKLVNQGFYNGLTFHRVIPGFMIQGGDPKGDGTGGPDYTIPAEISKNLSHVAGAVATARLSDQVNPKKDSSGSQFYIVQDDTGATSLNGDYTIFAQVIEGQNVVEAIAQVQTNPYTNMPLQKVTIEKVTLAKY